MQYLAVILLGVSLAFSQSRDILDGFDFDRDAGSASYQMLKVNKDARIVGLGGAGVATSGTALAASEMNPAFLASDSFNLYLGQGYPFQESETVVSSGLWNIPYGQHHFSFHYRFMGTENIQGYSNLDEPTGDYSAHTYKVQLGYGGKLGPVYWGTGFSYVENNIAWADYRTGVYDLGFQTQKYYGLALGASATNLPFYTSDAVNPENENPFPPSAIRAGLAYSTKWKHQLHFMAALDGRTRNDETLNLPAGLEVSWRRLLTFRMGYPFLERGAALSFGAGLEFKRIRLDYGLKRHDILSPGHFWTLGVHL